MIWQTISAIGSVASAVGILFAIFWYLRDRREGFRIMKSLEGLLKGQQEILGNQSQILDLIQAHNMEADLSSAQSKGLIKHTSPWELTEEGRSIILSEGVSESISIAIRKGPPQRSISDKAVAIVREIGGINKLSSLASRHGLTSGEALALMITYANEIESGEFKGV